MGGVPPVLPPPGPPDRSGASFRLRERCRYVGALALLAVGSPALAHNGPPFPIMQKRPTGPCFLSIWADPNVGQGTFYVLLDPLPGGQLPRDMEVEVGVRPLTGRLPEVRYPAPPKLLWGRTQYIAVANFDREEKWRIRVLLHSSAGKGEAATEVMVTPKGPQRLEFLLLFCPFLAVGYLWVKAFFRSRPARPGTTPTHRR